MEENAEPVHFSHAEDIQADGSSGFDGGDDDSCKEGTFACTSSAQACSDATEALGTVAAQRAAEAAPARVAAAGQAQALNARADYTLSRQPTAGDSCAALQALGSDWLKGRAKP